MSAQAFVRYLLLAAAALSMSPFLAHIVSAAETNPRSGQDQTR